MSRLDVSTIANPGSSVTVRLAGDLDLATADMLNARLQEVESGRPAEICIDLSELGFMDSTGLRLILQANGRALREGGRLILVEGRESVQRVFRVTGMQERLDFVEGDPGGSFDRS